MHILACKDLGTPECGYIASGESADDAVRMMIGHAKGAHGEKIAGKSDDELSEMMRPAVRME